MENDQNRDILERLLQAEVSKNVSEKLGTMLLGMGESTRGMTEADARTAKLMFLEFIRIAADEFLEKMKTRIESKKA